MDKSLDFTCNLSQGSQSKVSHVQPQSRDLLADSRPIRVDKETITDSQEIPSLDKGSIRYFRISGVRCT